MIVTQGQFFHYLKQPYNIILIVLPCRFCLHIIKVVFNQRKYEYGKKSLEDADLRARWHFSWDGQKEI